MCSTPVRVCVVRQCVILWCGCSPRPTGYHYRSFWRRLWTIRYFSLIPLPRTRVDRFFVCVSSSTMCACVLPMPVCLSKLMDAVHVKMLRIELSLSARSCRSLELQILPTSQYSLNSALRLLFCVSSCSSEILIEAPPPPLTPPTPRLLGIPKIAQKSFLTCRPPEVSSCRIGRFTRKMTGNGADSFRRRPKDCIEKEYIQES